MSVLDQINQGGTIYEIVPEIAELFKTTKAYHTGDHVIYEAGWYTFKADKSAGAWDATKVDGPFKVTDQLSDLKEDLKSIIIDEDNNVFIKLSDGTVSNKVQLADGCIMNGIFDTDVKISEYDKSLGDNQTTRNTVGACVTVKYELVGSPSFVMLYQANNGVSFNGYNDIWFYNGDTWVRHGSLSSNSLGTKPSGADVTHFMATLVTAKLDDSYAYDRDSGYIYFAGKNTPYYGKTYTTDQKKPTILTDENLDDVGFALMVGKDGKVHAGVDGLAIGTGIGISENVIADAVYETKPRIDKYNVANGDNQISTAKVGVCVSAKYKLVSSTSVVVLYQANTGVSWGGYNDIWFYDNDTWKHHRSITSNQIVRLAATGTDTHFCTNLVTAGLADSYAYDEATGYIYFAGENTDYYGLKYIYDVVPKAGLDAVFEEINTEVELLRNGNHNMIPLFLTTDQHGTSIRNAVGAFARNVLKENYSKALNLGDVVSDHWIDADPENPFWKDTTLQEFAESMNQVPAEKRIAIFGNHDTWYYDNSTPTYKAPQNHLYKYFRTGGIRRFDNYGNFTVVDDEYNVKYLCPSGYMYTGSASQYTHYELSSATIDWIIKELSYDDGYDIVILSHASVGVYGSTFSNPVKGTTHTLESITVFDYSPIWIARKNKTAGTITDEYGVTHSYDFTGCKTDLICGLHGHQHNDGVIYVGGVLCDLIFQCYSNKYSENVCYYLLIDRESNQANIWRIDTKTNAYTNYQLPFTQTI